MKKYKSFMFIFLGLLFVLAFAPLSVNAAESNGSSILDWDYTSNADGSITLTKYKGTSKDIVVPGKLDGRQVKIESFRKVGIASGESLLVGTPGQKVIFDGTSLQEAFAHSTYKSIDLKGLDTSKVTSMRCMFYQSEELTEVDVRTFDTSNVEDMCQMFAGTKITDLDVSNFNTSKVTTMQGMFEGCQFTDLDLSNFDTSNVTWIDGMFDGCSKLTSLDVSNFDSTNFTSTNEVFRNCHSLQYLNLGAMKYLPSNMNPADENFRIKGVNELPTVVISQNEATINVFSSDNGKTVHKSDGSGLRVAYVADVKLDANGGTFKEKATENEKTITLGSSNIFYDTVDAYKNEFTVTNDKLTEKTANPTKDGKEFNGWYLDKECTKPFTTLDMTVGHDSKVTLYAGYKAKKAEIDNPGTDKPAGDKNNGTGNPAEKMVNAVQTGDVSSPYFWAFIALLAMIGAAGTVLVRRKIIRTN